MLLRHELWALPSPKFQGEGNKIFTPASSGEDLCRGKLCICSNQSQPAFRKIQKNLFLFQAIAHKKSL